MEFIFTWLGMAESLHSVATGMPAKTNQLGNLLLSQAEEIKGSPKGQKE
jgi:hypothetical protein